MIAVRLAGLAAVVLALVGAPSAAAATRVAAPGGASSGTCVAPSPPCALNYAVSVAVNGDDVNVLPGDHSVGSVSGGSKSIDIHGAAGQPRPRVVTPGFALGGGSTTVSLRHLRIETGGTAVSAARTTGSGVLDDLVIVDASASAGHRSVSLQGGWILRDSQVDTSAPNSIAVFAAYGRSDVRNVTAHATADAIDAESPLGGICIPDNSVELTIKNVIARGGTNDIRAVGGCTNNSQVHVNVDHSNYRAGKAVITGAQPDDSLNDQGGNQTASEPLFAAPAALDFHQLPGSPTIDAGVTAPGAGATDYDGKPRVMGGAPDIGADEFPPPAAPPPPRDAVAPRASLLSVTPGTFRQRRGARIRYALTEPATMRFTIARASRGRRVGKRCVKPTRANRRRRACTRYVALKGSFSHRGDVGGNSFRFSGRLRGRRLATGRYRLTGAPTDAAGNRGKAVRTGFRVRR
jgi:hypothetical protein